MACITFLCLIISVHFSRMNKMPQLMQDKNRIDSKTIAKYISDEMSRGESLSQIRNDLQLLTDMMDYHMQFEEVSRKAIFVIAGPAFKLKKFAGIVISDSDNKRVMTGSTVSDRFELDNINEKYIYSASPVYAKGRIFGILTVTGVSKEELKIRILKNPCSVSIYNNQGILINNDNTNFTISFNGLETRCYKNISEDEDFFGLGEKTGYLNRRGRQYTMWNSDTPFYSKSQDPLYASIPFYIGLKGNTAYGIYLDNSYKTQFNFGAGNDRFMWFGTDGGNIDYYFFYGPSMKRVISSYTEITGRMKLPPLWALGYQQSRWSYSPDSEVRRIAKTFREKKIPCDVIYLDIDYMDGYRVFTWDKTRFPDPQKLLRDLSADGFKIVTIIDPGVKDDKNYSVAKEGLEKNLFAKYPDGVPYRGEVWPSWAFFPDFSDKKARDWWGEKIGGLLNIGVAGIWNDMNEPAVWGNNVPDMIRFNDNGFGADHRKIHNTYALLMAKTTDDAFKKYSSKRHLLLTRAGFAGIQRYSAMWTGDNVANNDHLQLACLMPQSMGLSGIAFAGSDVGGFGGYPSGKLYIRWMQLGAFTPFFRGHSATGEPDKEPWALGEEVEDASREAINLRYRFLPYIYNEFYRSTKTGLPIMRAMALEFQDDPECRSKDAQLQFMLGESLLVAPVLNEHDSFKKLYLPKGRWVNWWNGKILEGGRWLTTEVPIKQIPLYLKEGSIIPMQETQNWVGEKNATGMEFIIVPGNMTEYIFYEDDGQTLKYQDGAFSLTKISVLKNNAGSIEIILEKIKNGFSPEHTSFVFEVHDISGPVRVSADGLDLNEVDSREALPSKERAFFFDKDAGVVLAKTNANCQLLTIQPAKDS